MNELISNLEAFVRAGKPGDRLPTVRELIRQYDAPQTAVKQALADLRERNLITSHVGRGTFIADGEAVLGPAATQQTRILLLTKQGVMPRGSQAMQSLDELFAKDGFSPIQIIYRNFDDLHEILSKSPPFDGCILGTRFSIVPVSLLTSLKKLARVVLIDGSIVSGLDVDCVGIDWADALDVAVEKLVSIGHRRIMLLATDSQARPMTQAKRHFASLIRWGVVEGDERSLVLVENSGRRDTEVAADVLQKLRERASQITKRDYTAIITLGLFDGVSVLKGLETLGIGVPDGVSVIALGTNDIFLEHLDFLTTAGSSGSAAVALLRNLMRERLEDAPADFATHYLPVELIERKSCSPAE